MENNGKNDFHAEAIMDYIITYVRMHRKSCGLDPVWCPSPTKLGEMYKDIKEILDTEDNNGTI
jgi:hypothetical protein